MPQNGKGRTGGTSENRVFTFCPRCGRMLKVKTPLEGKRLMCSRCGFKGILKYIEGIGFELVPEDNVWILG